MSWLNAGFRSRLKELLDTLMSEALNHIIQRIVSLYSASIDSARIGGANHGS